MRDKRPTIDGLLAIGAVGLLVVAALVRELRLPILVLVAAGVAATVAIPAARPPLPRAHWAWAAALPAAAMLAWAMLPTPVPALGAADCANPGSPFSLWRTTEAVVALGLLAVAGLALGAGLRPLTDMGIHRPRTAELAACAICVAVLGPAGLALAQPLAEPFFGAREIELGLAGALLPAAVFAISNAVLEESVYRGALLRWLGRAIGLRTALVTQAVLFGLAHLGPDFVGSPAPVVGTMVAGALAAGWIVLRTGSLLVPIAAHAALDLPLYYATACRLG